MHQEIEEASEVTQQLQNLLYPKYVPGCSETEFLDTLQPLGEAIHRFDQNAEDIQDAELIDKAVMHIISLINSCLSHCPRREMMTMLMGQLSKCKGHLKDLAVGRQAIKYSKWPSLNTATNPLLKLYNTKEASLRSATDSLYLTHKKIPHLELLLTSYPGLLEAQQRIETAFGHEDSRIPPHHRHYLAIIASATFGSKYLWNRAANSFLAAGGDPLWLQEGVQAAPAVLQELSKISGLLAYNLRGFMRNKLFNSCTNKAGLDLEYVLEAIIILSYYQCLACLALTVGLISQSDSQESYLPKIPLQGTSYQSFDTVRRCDLQSEHQQKEAEELRDLFLLEPQEEEEIMNQFKSAKTVYDRKAVGFKFVQKVQHLKWYNQEPHLQEKLQNLRCLQQLKRTFSKFVDFEPLASAYETPKTRSQEELVLASEWQLQLQGLKRLQSVMGCKARGHLSELLSKLKVLGGEHGRRITHYYQFYNNYIHQFVSYTRLLQDVTPTERGYLKLITKSPFLFTETTYAHFQNDLRQKGIQPLNFVFDAVGCKFQLAITLATLQFDRAYEEASDEQ